MPEMPRVEYLYEGCKFLVWLIGEGVRKLREHQNYQIDLTELKFEAPYKKPYEAILTATHQAQTYGFSRRTLRYRKVEYYRLNLETILQPIVGGEPKRELTYKWEEENVIKDRVTKGFIKCRYRLNLSAEELFEVTNVAYRPGEQKEIWDVTKKLHEIKDLPIRKAPIVLPSLLLEDILWVAEGGPESTPVIKEVETGKYLRPQILYTSGPLIKKEGKIFSPQKYLIRVPVDFLKPEVDTKQLMGTIEDLPIEKGKKK